MKAVAVFVMFVGMIMVMQGYYNQTQHCPTVKTKLVMVPRSLYSEQMNPDRTVGQQFKSMFDDALTWPTTRG
jgi:hypothetical protein